MNPHADTGALTPSIDWLKRCFSGAFSSYLSVTHFSPINAGVKAPVSA